METELKLLVCGEVDVAAIIEKSVLPELKGRCDLSQVSLFNQYYDTPDKAFRSMGMGLRVRGQDGKYEQTIKTAGARRGSLQQRPEHNVVLAQPQPDLSLFDEQIWPQNAKVPSLQQQLDVIFTTHFQRRIFHLVLDQDTEIELVYDQGEISADGHQSEISEIEIELKSGEVNALFDVAERLVAVLPLRAGVMSKAARGYLLASGQELESEPLPGFVSLEPDCSVEQAFCRALDMGLNYWQWHEQCYLATQKPKALKGIRTGIHLVSQALNLYLPMLQCPELMALQKRLMTWLDDWYWVDALLEIKALRSRKGPFRKRLMKHQDFLSYLQGRYEGMLRQFRPADLICTKENTSLQLALTALAVRTPWREHDTAWKLPVIEHAKGWLAQSWFHISQSMPRDKVFNLQHYLSAESSLDQALFNSLFLADLFGEEKREQHRAPWLDILDGIDELKLLNLLMCELKQADVEHKDSLKAWCEDKISRLVQVMEQSRQLSQQREPA
ncbi:CYTH domain-containing protein [Lacimicrobium alkaliphilum]|uniref:Inorganic triphosphatase n=1 Tax=Lacimicrobium alkaliphilum TaxID=1526571 RepID=A0ABQ1QYG3_9ALTE|nr:CYTH domain-containing protein [Lacimicrobium alkaliphilum]GGD49855.1 inorganic triphosphatase [Lacimicrobium alkaliphilum]